MPFPKEALEKIKYLDGEELFKQYCAMGRAGSIKRLVAWCVENGKTNPNSGQPPTPMAVHNSMWRWALAHKDEAYKLYAVLQSEYGKFFSEDSWNGLLKHWASKKYRSTKYVKYINLHPEVANAVESHQPES